MVFETKNRLTWSWWVCVKLVVRIAARSSQLPWLALKEAWCRYCWISSTSLPEIGTWFGTVALAMTGRLEREISSCPAWIAVILLAAIDWRGTMANDDHEVKPETCAAIEKLLAAGVKVFIRSYCGKKRHTTFTHKKGCCFELWKWPGWGLLAFVSWNQLAAVGSGSTAGPPSGAKLLMRLPYAHPGSWWQSSPHRGGERCHTCWPWALGISSYVRAQWWSIVPDSTYCTGTTGLIRLQMASTRFCVFIFNPKKSWQRKSYIPTENSCIPWKMMVVRWNVLLKLSLSRGRTPSFVGV